MNAAVILFGVFVVCLIIGVPVSVSLGTASLSAVLLGDLGASSTVIAQRIFGGLQSTSIMAIAFFVLAGNLMTKGGISRRIVKFANCLVGNVRGGMGLALVLACAFFAALSGSAPATVIAIGTMLYGDMVDLGYPGDRTAGLLVVSGGLGPIIPPSIIMVIYCTLTGASVSNMFSQGMMIGVTIMVVLMAEVLFFAKKENWPKQNIHYTGKEILKIFLDAVPALMTPVIILGGIYSGLLTATESAAVAVVWATIAGLFIYKELTFKDLIPILKDSAKSAAMILFIIAASTAFSWVFTFSRRFAGFGGCRGGYAPEQDSVLPGRGYHPADFRYLYGGHGNRCSAGSGAVAYRTEHGHRRHPLRHDRLYLQCCRHHDPAGGRQYLLCIHCFRPEDGRYCQSRDPVLDWLCGCVLPLRVLGNILHIPAPLIV